MADAIKASHLAGIEFEEKNVKRSDTNIDLPVPPTRIVLATSFNYPHAGGLSTHVSLLARKLGLSQKDVLSGYSKKDKVGDVQRGLRYIRRKITGRHRIMDELMKFTKRIATIKCDLVHCHDALATRAALKAREHFSLPFHIVSTIHGPYSRHLVEGGLSPHSQYVKTAERIEREAWLGTDAIIAVDTLQGEIAKQQGANPGKITVIPNAVDVFQLDYSIRLIPLEKKGDRPWILVPRRLEPKNGVEYAIRALSLMLPKPLLLLAGSGSQESMLRLLTQELGLNDDVVFWGPLDQSILFPLMAAVDIVTIPSVPFHGVVEATSLSALEAMGLSKPIVASAIGGLKEIVRDELDGILVPPGDPPGLAKAWHRLLADDSLRIDIGNNARKRVEESFSIEKWFSMIRDVYKHVLQSGGDRV